MSDGQSGKYDAVIIGAGMGGLSAALELSINGKKVLLLEQRNVPGGIATSLVRGRFEFEATLHGMQGIGPKENHRVIRKFLEDVGVKVDFIDIPEAYRLVIPEENIDLVIPYGINQFIDAVQKESPGCKDDLKKLMELCSEIHDCIDKLDLNKNLKSFENFKKSRAFLQTSGYTAEEVIKTFNLPERALHIIYPYWLRLGVPMDKVSFTSWAYMMIDYISSKRAVVKNNSYGLSLAMDKRIRELGSDIRYSTLVDRVLVKNGQVVGITTNKGEIIETKYVISSAYPNKVYGSMIYPKEAVPKEAFKLNNARLLGCSTFCVYLGLDASCEELNIQNYTYFVGHCFDSKSMYENCKSLESPKYFTATCLNKIIPDCTPKGTTEVTISALQKGEAWEHVTPFRYNKIKRKIAYELVSDFSKVLGLDISSHIEEIETATPVTIARYTDSWNGSVYGYEDRIWNSYAVRMDTAGSEEYFKGLLFAGAHASNGNGYDYCIKSGRKAASNVLNLMKGVV